MSAWILYANQIRTLDGRLGFGENSLEFLAYTLDLRSGDIFDKLKDEHIKRPEPFYILLSHYAKSKTIPHVGKLIRFGDLPGGSAYEFAFTERAAVPIAQVFGSEPKKLVKAAKAFNGIKTEYGDASVEIPTLPKIPITYILWKNDEFSPSCSILFDASASNYLPTEDLAALGETATIRLKTSLERLSSK